MKRFFLIQWLIFKNKVKSTWLIWTRNDQHAARVDHKYSASDLYEASQGRWPK